MPPTYPVIRFLVTNGYWLAPLVGALPVLAAIWAVSVGWPWPLLLAGIVAGGVAWLFMRSYIEIMRIVSDTLVPR